MKNYSIIAILILILSGCASRNNPPLTNAAINEPQTDSFFPVTSYIKGQIITLDSLPITPLQVTTIKGKSDSLWLQKKDLKPLLLPFLTPAINEINFIRYFREIKFQDQTLNAITFTYDPIGVIPDSITLRHWDIYINPETGDVTKVYIVKQIKEHGQIITQQLTWQANKFAKITTILNKPDGNMELLKEVVFILNFN